MYVRCHRNPLDEHYRAKTEFYLYKLNCTRILHCKFKVEFRLEYVIVFLPMKSYEFYSPPNFRADETRESESDQS